MPKKLIISRGKQEYIDLTPEEIIEMEQRQQDAVEQESIKQAQEQQVANAVARLKVTAQTNNTVRDILILLRHLNDVVN